MVGYIDYQNGGNDYFVPNGVNTSGATDSRYRVQHRFMLNENDGEEKGLSEWFKELREERQFTPTIRNATYLYHDLRYGGTTELDKQFPMIRAHIEAKQEKRITELEAENRLLKEQLERLEKLLTSGQVRHTTQPTEVDASEIELEVTAAKTDENNRSDWNFMIASAAQVYGNFDSLPPEIIDYGVRVGKIPADMVKRDKSVTAPKNPKQMDVPQFDAPEFDDLTI